MPFIAECPFCKKGRLNCPDNAVGKSGTCPNPECGLSFTVVKPSRAPQVPLSGPRRRSPRLAAQVAAASPQSASGPATSTPTTSTPIEPRAGSPSETTEARHDPEPPSPGKRPSPSYVTGTEPEGLAPGRLSINALAAASLLLAGLGLCWASLSALDFVAYSLSGGAVLVGFGGFLAATREQHGAVLAAVGPIIGVLTVVVLLAAPGLFDPMRGMMAPPKRTESAERTVIQLSKSGKSPPAPVPLDGEWIDASKGAVQFGDLWLRLAAATIEAVELETSAKQKQRTAERYLVLRVEAANNGVQRRIDYESWADLTGQKSKHRSVLRSGRSTLAQRTFTNARVTGQVQTGFIMPGKHLDEMLIFELPPERFESLRLELPLSAFGMEGKVQWQIPRGMIQVK